METTTLPSPEVMAILKDLKLDTSKEIKNLQAAAEAAKSPLDRYLDQFITQYPDMLRLKEEVRKIAPTNYPVLIIGESGTGKELLANALHGNRKGRFLAVNCAGIPDTLIESELFGHVKGAFTGASMDKLGLMQHARDGTIFLDEIGDLSLDAQAKLLRAIQESKIRQVGGTIDIDINCRIVAATHKDLERDTAHKFGRFREDLFWRISAFILRPMPLRERRKDIPLLVKYLDKESRIKNIEEFCGRLDDLPGNVRSLQNIIIRYYILGRMP